MANTAKTPAAPAGDEELFDQAVNAESQTAFDGATTETPQEPAPPEPPQRHTVPLNELLDERDRRRQAEKRLEDIEAERQRAQPPPDFLMQPDQYFDRRLNEALDPIRRQFTMQLAAANKAIATQIHGAELVEEAQKAFDTEVQQGKLHPAEHAKVWSSANPFAAAVEWHNNRRLLAEVGNDPKAYRERLLNEALADPEFLGRAIEAARSGGARPVSVGPQPQPRRASSPPAANAGRNPPLPSLNRQGPPGGTPPQLSDLGDDDLYAEMTNPNKLTE